MDIKQGGVTYEKIIITMLSIVILSTAVIVFLVKSPQAPAEELTAEEDVVSSESEAVESEEEPDLYQTAEDINNFIKENEYEGYCRVCYDESLGKSVVMVLNRGGRPVDPEVMKKFEISPGKIQEYVDSKGYTDYVVVFIKE